MLHYLQEVSFWNLPNPHQDYDLQVWEKYCESKLKINPWKVAWCQTFKSAYKNPLILGYIEDITEVLLVA